MPPVPKSPKKAKTKGAQRAKSGCYTCRIRRKKCDEVQDEEGRCSTCVRLKLQCLGFGAKRPEWLREQENVVNLREQIKSFLASKGLIKGCSTSRSKNMDAEAMVLQLDPEIDNDTASSSQGSSSAMGTPRYNTISLSEESYRHVKISDARDERPVVTYGYESASGFPDSQPADPRFFHDPCTSPMLTSGADFSITDDEYGLPPTSGMPNQCQCNVVIPFKSLNLEAFMALAEGPNRLEESSFPIYNVPFSNLLEPDREPFELEQEQPHGVFPCYSVLPHVRQPDLWLKQYTKLIIGVQYLLASNEDWERVIHSIQTNDFTRYAAWLLTATYESRISTRNSARVVRLFDGYYDEQEEDNRIKSAIEGMKGLIYNKATFDVNDAMGALHFISVYLFSGGTGNWRPWLELACRFTRTVVSSSYDYGNLGASLERLLLHLDEKALFTIKTAIWFDVLASVTTGEQPILMDIIERLFSPNTARIDGPSSSIPPKLSMTSVMGCENSVVWALAKTSQLAVWKRRAEESGSLCQFELCRKGLEIDKVLDVTNLNRSYDPLYDDSGYAVAECLGRGYQGQGPLSIEEVREQTAKIFRHSTRVYLNSVVSGDYPSCRGIRESVQATIDCFGQTPRLTPNGVNGRSGLKETWNPIVRSVVFSIFICGCLAEDDESRLLLQERLTQQTLEGVGNGSKVHMLMERVAKSRLRKKKSDPVGWKTMLKESGLLLV